MKLIKYGITLKRLTENDIEMVREWRNSPLINQYMEYREYITLQMQQKWFKSINNFNNFYYLIEYKNEIIGLINDKNMNWEEKTSESGLFLWETKYYNTFIPVLTSLCLIEMAFYILQWKKSFIKILKTNHKAIEYNINLGYVLCDNQENIDNQLYVLTKQSFEQKADKLRKTALKISGNDPTAYLILEEIDYINGIGQKIEKIIHSSKLPIKHKMVNKEKVFYY